MGATGSSHSSPHRKYVGATGTPIAANFAIKDTKLHFCDGKRQRMKSIRGRPYGIKGMNRLSFLKSAYSLF
jgi:hypothetical protein